MWSQMFTTEDAPRKIFELHVGLKETTEIPCIPTRYNNKSEELSRQRTKKAHVKKVSQILQQREDGAGESKERERKTTRSPWKKVSANPLHCRSHPPYRTYFTYVNV